MRAPEVRGWVGRWVFASRRIAEELERASGPAAVAPDVDKARSFDPADALAFASAELAAIRAPITRALLAEAVWRYTWPHDRLVLGASRLIRDVDRMVPGKRITVHANRGLAGIDGTIATATGIALASRRAADEAGTPGGVTRVLLGDLALLHDVGSLLLGVGEPRPHLQVVVGNDGGGTIFDGLEVAGTAPAPAFDRVLYTPQSVDLAALGAGVRLAPHRRAHQGRTRPGAVGAAGRGQYPRSPAVPLTHKPDPSDADAFWRSRTTNTAASR